MGTAQACTKDCRASTRRDRPRALSPSDLGAGGRPGALWAAPMLLPRLLLKPFTSSRQPVGEG